MLIRHFAGEATEPYTGLGGIRQARRHLLFATAMEQEPDGYLPVLADLCSSAPEAETLNTVGCVRCANQLDTHAFRHIHLSESADRAVARYAAARRDALELVGAASYACPDAFDRPLYAVLPTFVERRRAEIEAALTRYLDAYREVIRVLSEESRSSPVGRGVRSFLPRLRCELEQ